MNAKSLSVTIALLLIQTHMSAQPSETQQWLTDSSRSIQFGIGNYLSLNAFDGKSISFKLHNTATNAIRFGFTLSGNTASSDATTETIVDDTLISTTTTSTDPTFSINVDAFVHFLWYLDTHSDVFPFIGIGPMVGFVRNEYVSTSSSSLTRTLGVGAEAVVGAEWFATKNISLHAEYQATALFEYTRYESYEPGTVGGQTPSKNFKRTIKSWAIRSRTVVFGLSVYL